MAEASFRAKWHLDPSSRLATIHGLKSGDCAPLGSGELAPHLHNVAVDEAYLRAKFHLDPSKRLVTIRQRHT